MAAEMAKLMPKASAAIIGEPSMMKAVSGHKGGLGIKTHVRGFEVHSSLQHIGVSAIHEAAKLIEWANQMNIQNESKKCARIFITDKNAERRAKQPRRSEEGSTR